MRPSNAVPQVLKSVRGQLLTVDEAVRITRLGKDWFYRHMKNGTLPFPWFTLTTGKRFMDSADIDNWLRLMKVPAGKMPGNIKEGVM
jgi:predicted DNA-binding transcriptional regulator AlpA